MSNFDYTSRDYTSIQQDLLDRASRIIPEWTSRDASDFGMVFVDLWAYMGDILHYYVDRAAGESYLATATQRESVLSIASLFDYIPAGRSSALGEVTLDIRNSVGTDTAPVLIPRYTRFLASPRVASASPVVFTLNSGIAITENITDFYTDPATNIRYVAYAKNTSSTISVPVAEGERYEEFYTANGDIGFRVRLANTGVVRESVEVEVTEGVSGSYVVYAPVTRLLEATSNERVFTLEMTPDDYSILSFGNGVNGIVPQPNSTVKVNYRRSRGAAGNLPPYSINAFDTITLSTGANIAGITVVGNQAPTNGGSNSESLELMKVNIPLSFRTQDRAVSLQDYTDLVLTVPGVAKAIAQVMMGQVVIWAVEYTSDYASLTSTQGTLSLSPALIDEINSFLEDRTMVGVDYSVQTASILGKVDITLSLAVLNNYIREKVVNDVRDAILGLFSFDNVSFGGFVSLGTLYRTILSVPGVDYTNITQFTSLGVPGIDVSGGVQGVQATPNMLLYIASDDLPTFSTVTGGIIGSGS
jgi:hypothetical protein